MGDRRITVDAVGACPKKKVARNEFVEFERVLMPAVDGLEIPRLAHPDVLLARISRNIANTVLGQHVNNEAGAIHSTAGGIGGAVLVVQVPRRQLQRGVDDLPHEWRIVFVTGYVFGRDGGRRSLFLGRR